jgi:hypothetical protein
MKPLILIVAGVCFLLLRRPWPAMAEELQTTVHPADTGAVLGNPGMGWVLHFYDNVPRNYGSKLAPSDTVDDFPGLTVVYLRIPWSYVEPEEGKFNWAVVDTPGQRWIAKGRQVAFRFSCSESWMRYATPKWVQDAGAKGYDFEPGKGVVEGGPFWEPDYDDPIFLEKLDRFLTAAAQRYDGSPEVAFVDVGSFGVWGEGHTYASSGLGFSAETVKKQIDLHLKHFKHTLLAANDDFVSQGRGDETIEYARQKGLTLRDDSILVQGGKNAYFHAEMAQAFWPTVPVILESEHYGGSRDRGNWKDGSQYLEAVEEYHASYASIHWWPREFLDENRDLVARMNQRLGYRLQLTEAAWTTASRVEGTFQFSSKWRNAGVAPCYPGGFPALTLKDAKGGIAGVFVDEAFEVRSLSVAPPGQAETLTQQATFACPFNLASGTYDVYVSVGTRAGTPQIALPLPDEDGQRRYRLGRLTVRGQYDVQTGALTRAGDQWLLPLTWTIHEPLPEGVRPFCHFEQNGRLAFQGEPAAGGPGADLSKPGTVALGCTFAVPDEMKGGAFTTLVGLWDPSRLGKPDERMTPDHGDQERRVVVGTLTVSAEGAPSLALTGPLLER